MLRPLYILLLLAVCLPASGQSPAYLLEPLTYRQGLSDNRVRAIAQDAKGFIWIGTAHGLNRYDGYTFWHYFPVKDDTLSLPSPTVNTIVKDAKGVLWLGTANGICRLRPGRWEFDRVFCYPNRIQDQRYAYFESICPDKKGRIWAVNSYNQLFRIHPDQGRADTITLPPVGNIPASLPPEARLTPPRITSVAPCGDTAVLIGSTYGLFQFHLEKETFRLIPVDGAWLFGLANIVPAGGDAFWCSTYLNGTFLVRINNGAVRHFPGPEPTPHDMMPLSGGRLWIAGVSGLTELTPYLDRSEKIKLPFESDISLNAECLFKDRAGTIWIGTDNGLVKYDPHLQGFQYTEVHQETATIYENDICDVHHNPDDGLWYVASRQQSAIFVLDSQSRLRHRISPLPLASEPSRIFRDSKGQVWVTTRSQVFLLDRTNFTLQPVPTPPRREGRAGLIWSIAEDPKGRMWFGLSRDGVYIYDPKNGNTRILGPEDGFTALRIYKIIVDRGGRYAWIATDGEGFYECDLATLKCRRYDDGTLEGLNSGGALVQDDAGRVWIGTTAGLIRYDPAAPPDRAFRVFTRADGLPMNYVEGGIKDRQGDLWFGAGDRVVRIDPETNRIKTFDYRYGASRTPFGYSDFSMSTDGELYAGGRRGFLRWRPELLRDNQSPPEVVVTNLRALQENIPAPTANVGWIRLAPDENSFSVEFAALNFTLPENNLYQWKLEGYDENWTAPSSLRQANYAHIAPGTYTLQVKAANSDGVWNPKPLAIQVMILPAYWQTWWFRILVVMTLGGLTYAFFRWRLRLIRDRDRLQNTYNQRLAEVEMSALRAQMNPHFIFNCLNSINRYILLNQPLVASQYLTKFARLIRLVLDNSKSEMISLEKELETLRLYIEMEAVRFEGRFQYQINVDEAVDPGSIDIPPMLIQPYIENAIWHGLMHKKGNDGLLQVDVELRNHDLIIKVTDNGVGREAAHTLKSKSASEHKSHGMAVTAERLKLLSNLYNSEIHAHVEDLIFHDGTPAGTQVVLTIPALN